MEVASTMEVLKALAPPVIWSSLTVGAFTGAAGLALGGLAGTIRAQTPLLFAIASGIQCGAIGTIFWSSRQCLKLRFAHSNGGQLQDVTPRERVQASTMAGAFTGATAGALFRGKSNVIPGTIMFSLFGYLGQKLYNANDSREISQPATDEGATVQRFFRSKYNPIKIITDEEYEHLMEEKLLRVEAEIALIDDDLVRLRSENDEKK